MDIAELLAYAVKNKASDLHLKVGSHPVVRVNGELVTEFVPLAAVLEDAAEQEEG